MIWIYENDLKSLLKFMRSDYLFRTDFGDFKMITDTKVHVAICVTVNAESWLRYGAGPHMTNAPLREKKCELFWKVTSAHCIQAMM